MMVHAGHRHPSASDALSPSRPSNAAPKPRTNAVASRYLSPSSGKPTSTPPFSAAASFTVSVSLAPTRLAPAVEPPRPVPPSNADAAPAGGGATTTRTLSVAFQSPSYSLDTSKTRPVTPAAAAAITPEKRKCNAVPWPASASAALRAFHGRALIKTLHRSSNKKELPAAAAARSASFEEERRRASVDGGEHLQAALSSDTDSASSAGSQDGGGGGSGIVPGARPSPRAKRSIMTPSVRLSRDGVGSLSDRFAYKATPLLPRSSLSSLTPAPAKKKSLLNGLFGRPSPTKPATTSSPRKTTNRSPSPVRSSPAVPGFAMKIQGINLDGDTRRKSPAVCKAEEEHQLRVLYNRHLQWRRANAHADAASSAQARASEEYFYSAWVAILGMRKSVALRKFQLQLFHNNCKLMAILRGQMIYLEEWSFLEKKHATSLWATVEALNANILRLPVSDGAVADIEAVKNAVGTAIDVMQTIGNSTGTLSKLARTNVLASQLSRTAKQEHVIMAQCRDLMSTLISMHVRYSSLQGQWIQQNQRMPWRF